MFSARQALLNASSSDQEYQAMVQQLASGAHTSIDEGYLHALYFPEHSSPARIPTNFGVPSSLITQRFSFYINTYGAQDGFVAMLPQDLTGYMCYRSIGIVDTTVNVAGQAFPQWTGDRQSLNPCVIVDESSSQYIADNFAHARVVGASMRVAYIGAQDEESGFLTAAHIYDKRVVELSEEGIEDGYYVTRARPNDGIRLVYQPRDEKDFQYVALDTKWDMKASGYYEKIGPNGTQGKNVSLLTVDDILIGGSPSKDEIIDSGYNFNLYTLALPNSLNTNNYSQSALQWRVGGPNIQQHGYGPLQKIWGAGPHIGQNPTPQICVFYYKGVPQSTTLFRIDVVRHLECIPRTTLRDIVSVERPFHNQESINIAAGLGQSLPHLHSSTLEAADHLKRGMHHAMLQGSRLGDFAKGVMHTLNPKNWTPAARLAVKTWAKTVFSGALEEFGPGAVMIGNGVWDLTDKAIQHGVYHQTQSGLDLGGTRLTTNIDTRKEMAYRM